MSDSQFEALVVGAGPAGLAMGLSLAQSGIRALVIDKNAARCQESRALAVHAGTLEAFDATLGHKHSQALLDAGRPASEMFVHLDAHEPVRIDLGLVPSRYNFILMIEQSETERVLGEQLAAAGGAVERPCELLAIRDEGERVIASLRDGNGVVREVSASYAIGCDGAHSTVRKQLGFTFEGSPYSGDFLLADVELRWPWPYGGVHLFSSAKGSLACFPIRGERRYRLIAIPRNLVEHAQSTLTLDELKAEIAPLTPEPIQVESSRWLTRFHVSHRMTDHFRKGRVFLAGDAAHIHSPAGGQGMNTGIQDALFLGQRLERVLKHGAADSLLDEYQAMRMPVARKVLRGTDAMFRLAMSQENRAIAFGRAHLVPRLIGVKALQRRMMRAVSEVDVARAHFPAR